MATRFYFQTSGAGVLTPSQMADFDSGWEHLNGSVGRKLQNKLMTTFGGIDGFSSIATPPVGTTGDYVIAQYVSDTIPVQTISGTFSMVVKAWENDSGVNATLSVVVRVISGDFQTVRGTLFSVFSTDTEFPTTDATRIVNAQSVTPITTEGGDRIVLEYGCRITNNTVADSAGSDAYIFIGNTDFALSSGLTTNLNNWCEFSKDIWPVNMPPSLSNKITTPNNISCVGALS